MKKLILAILLLPNMAFAKSFDYSFSVKTLYGYSTDDDKSHLPTELDASFSYDIKNTTLYLDLYQSFDKQNQPYNEGYWGYSAYAITQTKLGDIQIGQMSNVANQFYVGAFEDPYFDITDFISNPSWQSTDIITQNTTFNTTAINTDGLAPKISYISPEIYNTYLGLTYTPDIYDGTGITTSEGKQGYIASILNHQDFGKIDVSTSLSYAYFTDIDQEYSASVKLSYGNYYLSGGYRQSFAKGKEPIELYNGYRDATSYDIGTGYSFGPYEAKVSYLSSSSDEFNYKDQYVALSQSYQLNKNFDIYLIGAYAEFENKESQEGFALITGVKISL